MDPQRLCDFRVHHHGAPTTSYAVLRTGLYTCSMTVAYCQQCDCTPHDPLKVASHRGRWHTNGWLNAAACAQKDAILMLDTNPMRGAPRQIPARRPHKRTIATALLWGVTFLFGGLAGIISVSTPTNDHMASAPHPTIPCGDQPGVCPNPSSMNLD